MPLASEDTPVEDSGRATQDDAAIANQEDAAIPNAEQKGFCMPLERIRLSNPIVFFLMFLVGCLSPDRAGVDHVTRSGDRTTTAGDHATTEQTARATIPSPISRAQSVDVGLAPTRSSGSVPSQGQVVQASGRDPGPPGNSQRAALATGNNPPPAALSQTSLAGASDSSAKLRELYNQAALRFATIDSYVARLRRREQVKGKDQPEELILFKFRKRPWSVYFKWLGPTGIGREVIYVKGRHGDMIHTLLAAGDMPLAPAGKHMALAPDNIFVRSASRHAITEAGIGVMIEKFGRGLESQERGERRFGTITYVGPTKRPEYDAPLETMEHVLPPGVEPQLPHGGRRWLYFDPASHLPVLMITHDGKDHEVEYYCYDRLQYPVKLDDLDFDPDRLWPARK